MATCLHPISVRGILYPCGKCPVCRQNYRQSKGERFLLACAFNKKKGSNFFVTLTYDDDNLNYAQAPNTYKGDFFPCFRKQDIKVLFDKIRRLKGIECKYFCTAEYGEDTHRPHYHLLVLFPRKLTLAQADELFQKCWLKGFHQVSYCNDSRVQYAAKYVLKDDLYFKSIEGFNYVYSLQEYQYWRESIWSEKVTWNALQVKNWDCRKPFTLISNNFLSEDAVNYLNEYIYNDGNIREFFVFNGKRVNFDTYIKNHIDSSVKAELDALRESRNIEYQDTLQVSRQVHSKVDDFGKLHSDFSFDMEIYKHREKLKQLKKNKRL